MTETGKNWHKKLLPTLYAYAGANTFNSNCFKVSDKVDDGIMKEALLDFYTSSGKRKPDQIIIFRDGVSESQFNQGSPDNVLHGTVIDNKSNQWGNETKH
ncbi:Protein argonaute 8 -like protein [Gossypium arboreum]|uniref:Protein argonaute 8-like protein n=1 Tax=Gossypium arboreum TaxID=29729 RepID=A0A0B0PVG7_GOSAR|nr:Protein argonaute 8 -like protein [Gossypium arboreum]